MNVFLNLRKKAGLKQTDVARAIGVSPVAVSQWENGIFNPKFDNLLKITELYGCSLNDLLNDEILMRKQEDTDGKTNA